jgi:hypothetical protein
MPVARHGIPLEEDASCVAILRFAVLRTHFATVIGSGAGVDLVVVSEDVTADVRYAAKQRGRYNIRTWAEV